MAKGLLPSKNDVKHLWFPVGFTVLIIILYALFNSFTAFTTFGVYPRTAQGLQGILFSPLVHGSWEHVLSNALPLALLGGLLFTIYREIAYKVFFIIYFTTGFWVWIMARDSYHIGASGVLYGLWTFILFSGFMRRRADLVVASFFVAFLYGSMFWGLFPLIPHVSFESHIAGAMAGIMCAIYFLRQGPQAVKYEWKDEDELPDSPDAPWNQPDDEKEKFD